MSDTSTAPDVQTLSAKLEIAVNRADAAERRITAMGIDLQNLQVDVIAKNRQIGQLKARVTELTDPPAESDDREKAKGLLMLWRTEIKAGSKRFSVDLDTPRGRHVLAMGKRKGWERCQNAVLGCKLDDWAMGRLHKSGGKDFSDIAKHILKDDETVERFESLFLRHQTPTLLDPAPEPERPAPDDRASVEYRARARFYQETSPIDRVLGAIDRSSGFQAGTSGDSWSALCPAHDDRSPSLSIHRKPDGKVLLHCWAGCDTQDVLAALGLEWIDLFAGTENDYSNPHHYRDRRPRFQRTQPHLRAALHEVHAALVRMEQEQAA